MVFIPNNARQPPPTPSHTLPMTIMKPCLSRFNGNWDIMVGEEAPFPPFLYILLSRLNAVIQIEFCRVGCLGYGQALLFFNLNIRINHIVGEYAASSQKVMISL